MTRFNTANHEALARELCSGLETLIDLAAEYGELTSGTDAGRLPVSILARRLLRTDEDLRRLKDDLELLRHAIAVAQEKSDRPGLRR